MFCVIKNSKTINIKDHKLIILLKFINEVESIDTINYYYFLIYNKIL